MRRLVVVKVFVFPSWRFLSLPLDLERSSRASIRTLSEPFWVGCMLVSDDDEVALLSENRPCWPHPLAQSPEPDSP
jgi:hypothetical protein